MLWHKGCLDNSVPRSEVSMNKLLSLAIFGVLFSVPAYAQRGMSAGLGPNGVGYAPGGMAGSGGGSGGGYGGSSNGSVTFHTLPEEPPAHFNVIEVSGTSDGFVPSSWTQFAQGLAQGRALLATRQKSLGEVAAENRHAEKPKAKFEIVQDASGKVVIQRR
jgi:hypothetical protein